MAIEFSPAFADLSSKSGLSFDADTITLSGRFTDELSAYRARLIWREVFNNYFLLDKERDYQMKVEPGDEFYSLLCVFSSACGRYAFWRMINGQAPDAERKLYAPNLISEHCTKYLLGAAWKSGTHTPYILTGPSQSQPRGGLFSSLVSVLRKSLSPRPKFPR